MILIAATQFRPKTVSIFVANVVAVSSERFPRYRSLFRHNLAIAHSRKIVGFFIFNVFTVSFALSKFQEYRFLFYWDNLCYLVT